MQVQFLMMFTLTTTTHFPMTLITAIDLCEQRWKIYEPSIRPCSPWVLRSSVDRVPAYCLGSHRFESCQGLRFFLCSMLVSSSHLFTEPKICFLSFFHQKRKRLYILSKSKKITPVNTKGIVFLSCEYLGNPFLFHKQVSCLGCSILTLVHASLLSR